MDRGALLAVVLASGCTTRQGSLKWSAAGVGMVIVGGLVLHSMSGDDEASVPLTLGSAGLVFGGGGIAIFSALDAIFATDPVVADAPPPRVSTAEHEACLEQRRAISRRANTITNLGKRARVLQTMPDCGAPSPPQ